MPSQQLTEAAKLIRSMAHALGIDRYSINEVVRSYRDVLYRLIVDAANGNITRRAFVNDMQQEIIDKATEVYTEGLREGSSGEVELSDTDTATIRDWILSQTSHVGSFADDARAVNLETGDARTEARNVIEGRIDTWVNALNQLGLLALANAKGDPMLTFDGDDGKESCKDCQKYKGKRHKKSWWESRGLLPRNGNPNFECGRWDNCKHNYFYDDGSLAL